MDKETKQCTKCLKILPLDSFRLRMDKGKLRLRSRCRECHRLEVRESRVRKLRVTGSWEPVLTMQQLEDLCNTLRENKVI